MSEQRQCSARVYGDRVQSWPCQKNATVERNAKWFCSSHDPERKKQRDEKWHADRKAREAADDAVKAEGMAILAALGIKGDVYYHSASTASNSRYVRRLVIDFDTAKRLVQP